MQTSFLEEYVRFACPSGGQKPRQSAAPRPECLRGAPATAAIRPEIHSDGSKGRCEIRPAPSSPVDYGSLQPPGERPPDESECIPNARTPFPAARATV